MKYEPGILASTIEHDHRKARLDVDEKRDARRAADRVLREAQAKVRDAEVAYDAACAVERRAWEREEALFTAWQARLAEERAPKAEKAGAS